MVVYRKIVLALFLLICLSAVTGLCGCSGEPEDIAQGTAVAAETSISEERSSLTVSFNQGSGAYEAEFNLVITCSGQAQIYYTTDGSDPVTSVTRNLYTSPIKIEDRSNDENYVSAVDPFLFDAANVKVNKTGDGFVYSLGSGPSKDAVDKCTVIRAVGLDAQGLYTNVETNTYFIGSMADHVRGIEKSCAASGSSLAIISLSINYDDLFDPEKGIYVKGNMYNEAIRQTLAAGGKLSVDASRWMPANYLQKGREWERNAHIDLLESDGAVTSVELQQDCGIRIQGNHSRSDLQKGFRLFARDGYGKKDFNYPVFGKDLKDDLGETISKFKTLTLRNGGNCAFTTKFSDNYWQSLIKDLDCDTLTSRPCVLYINGEYWGLYVLQEDYSDNYFENAHKVNNHDVVLYKGDAQALEIGYKLDLGGLPEGETDESYYFRDLLDFFRTHESLSDQADYEEFSRLVDVESARDYFAVQIWINNKWDWPGKNWSMWKTINIDGSNRYADGRWRFVFYDIEFGGVMGKGDVKVNTIKEDNYKPLGLLDKGTTNPAVLIYAYLMTNSDFREDFAEALLALSENEFKYEKAMAALDVFKNTYSPLYDQFFARYSGAGSSDNSINGGYASYKCIKDFLAERANYIEPMLDYVDYVYGADNIN